MNNISDVKLNINRYQDVLELDVQTLPVSLKFLTSLDSFYL